MKKKNNKLRTHKLKYKLLIALLCILVLGSFFVYRFYHSKNNTSRTSAQVYSGTLPCADCPGIQTTLTLTNSSANTDQGTYVLESIYLERNDNKPFIDKGLWKLQKGMPNNPNALIYALDYDKPAMTTYFLKVDSAHIKQLDTDMKEIDSPFNMILTKQE